MPKKFKKSTYKKPLKPVVEDAEKPRSATDKCQFKLPEDVEKDKKVKPKDVFDDWKDPPKQKKKKKGRK
jgi:hypothetical protein